TRTRTADEANIILTFASRERKRLNSLRPVNAPTLSSPIQLRNVSRVFDGGVEAVRAMDLDIAAGEFLAMIGPGGCGKSTLLRMIAGLDRPTAGTIAGVDPGRIAFVFQDAHLLPWRRVLRNVSLPMELRGHARGHCLERAMAAIEQVGLSDAINR